MGHTGTLYDKTGAAFSLDHEVDGTAYVRPLVKVVIHTHGYEGGSFDVDEDYEPADYLVSMARASLFDAPPVAEINEDIAAKKAELVSLKSDAAKALREIKSARSAAESELRSAKRQLSEWMETHRVMTDLGRLLDGQVLYPLSVRENSYHRSREIPYIPEAHGMALLSVHSGDFETGKPWRVQGRHTDTYGRPFQFFYTEEERDAAIRSEFDEACQAFRKAPNFTVDIYTTTKLHYGTLLEWVKTHPILSIPDDIQSMKADNDAELIKERKAKLAAELAALPA